MSLCKGQLRRCPATVTLIVQGSQELVWVSILERREHLRENLRCFLFAHPAVQPVLGRDCHYVDYIQAYRTGVFENQTANLDSTG